MESAVVPILGQLIARHARDFTEHSAITAPAVLAGIGIAVHHTMPWSDPASAFRTDDLVRLLDGVHWEREAKYWDGVAAKTGTSGRLNFSGGVKDSGGRVAEAILYPATEAGRRIAERYSHAGDRLRLCPGRPRCLRNGTGVPLCLPVAPAVCRPVAGRPPLGKQYGCYWKWTRRATARYWANAEVMRTVMHPLLIPPQHGDI